MRLFRRVAAPFRRVRKEMHLVKEDFDNLANGISLKLDGSVEDLDRRFSDFFNTSMEMYDHQHRQLERFIIL